MAKVVIDYDVQGTDELAKANKEVEQLNKSNNLTEKSVEKTNQKFKEQSQIMGNLGSQLQATANRVNIMGVGLGDLGANLVKASTGAKTMTTAMKVLKVAIAATGIGALVLALGSLVTFFTKTQRGADKVSQAMAAIGATVDVVVDRMSGLGEILSNIFNQSLTETLSQVANNFSGITDEIVNETSAAVELEKASQALVRREIELTVEIRKRRAEIKALNKDAEDVTLSEQKRLDAANAAIAIESNLQKQRIALAQENLRIIRERNSLGESTIEDIRRESEAEAELFAIREESDELLTTLQNKRNILSNATIQAAEAEKEAEFAIQEERLLKFLEDQQLRIDGEVAAAEQLAERLAEIDDRHFARDEQALREHLKRQSDAEKKAADDAIKLEETKGRLKQELNATQATQLSALFTRESKAGKAFALLDIAASTRRAVMKAVAASPLTGGLPWSAIAVGLGAANAAQVIALRPPKFKEGGLIRGKSHDFGGEMIEAEGGEYVIRKEAVRAIGIPKLEALNKGVTVVTDTDKIAEAIKNQPQNHMIWDERGFTAYSRKKNTVMQRKAARYAL